MRETPDVSDEEVDASAEVQGETPSASRPVATPVAPSPEPTQAEKAKLIALNMALNGAAREETERYLIENLHFANPSALLAEVYAADAVEGA